MLLTYEEEVSSIENSNKTLSEKRVSIWLTKYRYIQLEKLDFEGGRGKNLSKIYEETIISCTFNLKPCLQTDFQIYYDNNFGVCFEFNGFEYFKRNGKYKQTLKEDGKASGLQIEMYLGNTGHMLLERGAHIVVRENTFHQLSLAEGFDITAGSISNVLVKRINTINKPEPYNQCKDLKTIDDFDSILYKETFKFYNKYKQM